MEEQNLYITLCIFTKIKKKLFQHNKGIGCEVANSTLKIDSPNQNALELDIMVEEF